jgi:hypothetical protein
MRGWRILDDRGDVIVVDTARYTAWRMSLTDDACVRVGADVIGEARISTVLRELANYYDWPWETIIFGGPWNIWMRQYRTREDAERGHRNVWERLNLGLPPSTDDEPNTD